MVKLINSRSTNRKTVFIHDFIGNENIELACITETGLSEMEDVNLFFVCPLGFVVQGLGGSVPIIYRKDCYIHQEACPATYRCRVSSPGYG